MSRFVLRFWLRGIFLVLFLLGLYALAGFWLAPRLIRSQATDYVRTELGQKLSLGEIRSNPFTFELEIRDIAIGDGGPHLVALKRAYVDFQAKSLWQGAWTFRVVSLDGPFARAIIRPDGSLNLADLIPKKKDDSPLPAIWIEALRITRGQVNFADQSRRLKPEKQFSPIEFELRDFHTTAEGGGFTLGAASSQGERFDWSGRLSLQPIASDGHFKVTALQARSVYEFLSEQLPFEISGGRFDAEGDYRFSAGTSEGTLLEAALPMASATDLALRVPGNERDWVTLPLVALKDTRLSLGKHAISVDSLTLTGTRVDAWLNADGTTNISQLFSGPAGAPPPAPAAAVSPVDSTTRSSSSAASTAAKPADWTFTLAHLDLQQGQLALEDRSVSPFAKFKLEPLAATADKLSLDLGKPVPITLQTMINGKAPLSLRGEVTPASLGASVTVAMGKLPMRDLLSYLPILPSLQLLSGTVEANGSLHLAAIGEQAPEISFDGSVGVDDVKLVQRSDQHELLSWNSMTIEGLQAQSKPDAASMKRIRLQGLFAQVEIAPDQSIRLLSMLNDPASQRAEASVALSRPMKSARAGTAPAAPPAAAASANPPVKIEEIVLSEGTMSFADYSVEPNFKARIDALRGTISNLSTAPDSVTSIDLDGQVINRYSPVSIKGETMPFAFDQHTDITLKFSNIELPIFNPYSGRYAGYAIAKGKLSTELRYQIDQRKLSASHHVVLDQLEWGAATESKDKVSLPVRLATSLLKDRHGVIDLNLPVTGTLDDPKFRIGPVVWQIVKNILTKIVTAPFSFLGSLFEGAEQAQFVDFTPGSPALSDTARSSLAALSKGLADRPALKIEIPVGVAPELDARALGQQHFEAAIAASKEGLPAYASLSTEDKLEALKQLYKQQFGKKPELPEPAEDAKDASRQDRKTAQAAASIDWLEAQLKPRFQPDAGVLAALGQGRAHAVQEVLLGGGELDPARVFLAGDKALTDKDGAARMEVGLE